MRRSFGNSTATEIVIFALKRIYLDVNVLFWSSRNDLGVSDRQTRSIGYGA